MTEWNIIMDISLKKLEVNWEKMKMKIFNFLAKIDTAYKICSQKF